MHTTKASPLDSLATSLRPAQLHWTRREPNLPILKPSQSDISTDRLRTPTVFVVDDDPEMRESLELLLLAESFPVETYDSADTFWEVFHPERRGCVILDLRMPGMDGLALLERLADYHHGLSVIVVSASADRDEKTRAKELGAIDFFPKPYETKKLLATIREQLFR